MHSLKPSWEFFGQVSLFKQHNIWTLRFKYVQIKMIFQICISLITRWDNKSQSYWETLLHGKVTEIKPNLLLTLPGGLRLQVLEWTSYYPKSERIQCGQNNIRSTILFPCRTAIVSFLKTWCLRENINRFCHCRPLKMWNNRLTGKIQLQTC